MRIGIDARFLGTPSYGLAQYSENLIGTLSQQDTVNEYVVFVNAGLKRRLKLGRNFRVMPIRGRPLSVKSMARLNLALRSDSFDIFHALFPVAPPGVPAPTLITVHDVVPFKHGLAHGLRFPVWDRAAGYFLYPMSMNRAKWIVCVSNAMRRELVALFPQVFHKTIVIRSGVEDAYRRPTEEETAELIVERLDLKGKYIIYSGSSAAVKNIPRMLEAFAMLRQREPLAAQVRFVLDVTGSPDELKEIERVAAQLKLKDSVKIFAGLTPDERRVVFEKAALFFNASMHEGFCTPAVRAQMCGVPVVAADAGALPEICGEGSLLVNPANLDEMATMLARGLFEEELRDYLIEKGRANAGRFPWSQTGHDIRQVYDLLF